MCIDHGASLIFHHNWAGTTPDRFAARPFDRSDHILTEVAAGRVAAAHDDLSARISERLLKEVLELVPDGWLEPTPGAEDPAGARNDTVAAVCRGDVSAGPAASLGERQRFEWLAAPRSTVVQPGPVHSGVARDPGAELEHLFEKLVL